MGTHQTEANRRALAREAARRGARVSIIVPPPWGAGEPPRAASDYTEAELVDNAVASAAAGLGRAMDELNEIAGAPGRRDPPPAAALVVGAWALLDRAGQPVTRNHAGFAATLLRLALPKIKAFPETEGRRVAEGLVRGALDATEAIARMDRARLADRRILCDIQRMPD